MRIFAHVHKYYPYHRAGAEAMLHSILVWMKERGHDCRVLIMHGNYPDQWEVDGIEVFRAGQSTDLRLYEWADVVITHLDLTREVVGKARARHKPVVHLIHNHRQLSFHRVTSRGADLVVFNSEWLQRIVGWKGAQTVVRPPVFCKHYSTKRGDRILLSNLTEPKGGPLFWELARTMPDVKFLATKGAYGVQIIPADVPGNVLLLENSPHAEIYQQTKATLMPSSYESWGRVAMESACSGIPTIAHPTEGLVESLGPAGIFINRTDTTQWHQEIRRLLEDPSYYDWRSHLARDRAGFWEANSLSELEVLEKSLLKLSHA